MWGLEWWGFFCLFLRIESLISHPLREISQLFKVNENSQEHNLNQRREVAGFAAKVTMALTPLGAAGSAQQVVVLGAKGLPQCSRQYHYQRFFLHS